MKKKYLILALYVQGKGKNIFKSKDVVSEDQLNNIPELIKGGYIKEILDETPKVEATENTTETETTENVEVKVEATENVEPILFTLKIGEEIREVRSVKDLKKKEIINALKGLEVEFNPISKEQILFDQLKEAVAK